VRVEIWGVREHEVEVVTKEAKWLEYVAVSVIRSFVNVFTKYYESDEIKKDEQEGKPEGKRLFSVTVGEDGRIIRNWICR
jgi:hypothetical protein